MNEHINFDTLPEVPSGAEVLEIYAAHPLARLETYKYFNQRGDQAAVAKRQFVESALAGDTPDTPGFEYESLDIDQLLQWRDEMTELLEYFTRVDESLVPRADFADEANLLVRENITNRIHEIGIMILTKLQSTMDVNDPNYELISLQLGENMREVYGKPEREHWRGILGYRLGQLSEVEHRENAPQEVMEAWEFIRERLPQDLPVVAPYKPKSETVEWYKAELEDRMAPAREAVSGAIFRGEVVVGENGKMDAENIVKATRLALAAYKAVGWDAATTDEANVDTTQADMMIYIPTTRQMDMNEFDRVIIGHEVDEHVARSFGGPGYNGYLGWEEGNGKANEGLIKGQSDLEASAFAFFLSAGLALGLESDDADGRNFGETFDIVWRMNLVADYLKGKVGSENMQDQESAC